MSKRPPLFLAFLALLLAALACNLPSAQSPQGPGAALTIAAKTVAAQLTANAILVTATPLPAAATATFPLLPSQTARPVFSPTSTAIPCNRAQFVSDVSIPDGTSLLIGSAFTKTWRFTNIGSCTWTSSYQLIFDHGDQMGGPVAQSLTSGSVAPGQTVDISVNLTAPSTPGSYKGFWQIRDQNGIVFGVSTGSFWVEIKAVAPTPTATITPTVTVTPTLPPAVNSINAPVVAGESGSVRSDGSVFTFVNVGDTDSNASQQGFVSFDISSLPSGANVLEVKVNFSNYDTLGSPFALGCLRLYPHNYGTVDASDFTGGSPSGAVVRWCNTGELSTTSFSAPDLKPTIQAAVGTSRVRFRLQFNEAATNNNGASDMVRFGNSLSLIISFTSP